MLTYMPTDRRSIACRVHQIVAGFCPSVSVDDPAEFPQLSGLSAREVEDAVAAMSDEAEGYSREWPGVGTNAVVTEVLASEALLDDYVRMLRGEQGYAFDDAGGE